MLSIYRPSDEEIMAEARSALQRQKVLQGLLPERISEGEAFQGSVARIAELRDLFGSAPEAFEKPSFGTPGYALAHALGWITKEEADSDRSAYEERRRRSQQSCHRFSLYERPRFEPPRESGAYVPALAARLENDRNLTDGARRCARKLAELTYRRNREGRSLDVTVTYLMKALGRCRRTVQRYLRLLEREGYIRAYVISSTFSRMSVGLVVELRGPLFARHHRKSWPKRSLQSLKNPGAATKSQNYSLQYYYQNRKRLISCYDWAFRCMDGVFRSVMKTVPPLSAAA